MVSMPIMKHQADVSHQHDWMQLAAVSDHSEISTGTCRLSLFGSGRTHSQHWPQVLAQDLTGRVGP